MALTKSGTTYLKCQHLSKTTKQRKDSAFSIYYNFDCSLQIIAVSQI